VPEASLCACVRACVRACVCARARGVGRRVGGRLASMSGHTEPSFLKISNVSYPTWQQSHRRRTKSFARLRALFNQSPPRSRLVSEKVKGGDQRSGARRYREIQVTSPSCSLSGAAEISCVFQKERKRERVAERTSENERERARTSENERERARERERERERESEGKREREGERERERVGERQMAGFGARDNGPKAAVSALFFDLDNTLIETRKGDSLACRKV
jgi:hypothetical protein